VWQHEGVSLSPRGVAAGAGLGGGQEDALGVIFFWINETHYLQCLLLSLVCWLWDSIWIIVTSTLARCFSSLFFSLYTYAYTYMYCYYYCILVLTKPAPAWVPVKASFSTSDTIVTLYRREPPVLGTPPNYRKVRAEDFPRKKNICYKLRFQVVLSQSIPRLFVLSLFLRMRVNNWNWKWNKKNNRHPCIRRRTCKIHKEKNQLKCQNRTWKWMAIPGVWRKSMLRVYGCVFCSISLLSVYMCVRIPWSSRSTAGVPSSRALPHFPPHTTCVS